MTPDLKQTVNLPPTNFSMRVVRLEPGQTKNDESRLVPLAGELLEMLRMQKDIRDEKWAGCPWVFFRSGKKIVDFRGAWERRMRRRRFGGR